MTVKELLHFVNTAKPFDGLAVEVGPKSGKGSITWPPRKDPTNRFSGFDEQYKLTEPLIIGGQPIKVGYLTLKAGQVETPETLFAKSVDVPSMKAYATAQRASGKSEDEILLDIASKLASL